MVLVFVHELPAHPSVGEALMAGQECAGFGRTLQLTTLATCVVHAGCLSTGDYKVCIVVHTLEAVRTDLEASKLARLYLCQATDFVARPAVSIGSMKVVLFRRQIHQPSQLIL